MSDILVSYFQSQICTAWDIATGQSYDSVPIVTASDPETHGLFGGVGQRKGAAPPTPDQNNGGIVDPADSKKGATAPHPVYPQLRVPGSLINSRPYSARPFEEVKPFCASANDLINPLPPSLFFGSGWFSYHPATGASGEVLHYWYSTLPTSKLRIPITVGAGDIGVYYLKEPIGSGDGGEGSAVECWVDDNYGGAKVIENAGEVGESTPSYVFICIFCDIPILTGYAPAGWRSLTIMSRVDHITSNVRYWVRRDRASLPSKSLESSPHNVAIMICAVALVNMNRMFCKLRPSGDRAR